MFDFGVLILRSLTLRTSTSTSPREVLTGTEHPRMERGDRAILGEIQSKGHPSLTDQIGNPWAVEAPVSHKEKVHKRLWLQFSVLQSQESEEALLQF